MKVEYSKRATADLQKVSADSRVFGKAVSASLENYIRSTVANIGRYPQAAPQVAERPSVHVTPLVRYPYKIIYRILKDRVRILHIRHTSRQPWSG